MNTQPNSILFAGEETTVSLRDNTAHRVRVRELPVRHHLELLGLFHVGHEAELIQRCTERRTDGGWEPVDAAFVDNLDDASHERLNDLAQKLNFSRAIKTAQRQIARGQEMRPLLDTIAQAMADPLRQQFESLTSSLTRQLSSALVASASSKKP